MVYKKYKVAEETCDAGWDFLRALADASIGAMVDQTESDYKTSRTYDLDGATLRVYGTRKSAIVCLIGEDKTIDKRTDEIVQRTGFRLIEEGGRDWINY